MSRLEKQERVKATKVQIVETNIVNNICKSKLFVYHC